MDVRGKSVGAAWQLLSSAGYDVTPAGAIIQKADLQRITDYILGNGSVFSIDRDLVEEFERALRERELRRDAERNTYPG